jgi:carbon-monoxide dehydrogenase medium subunit
MYPGRFDYHAPASLEDALRLLAEIGPGAKILAGGASLVPLMKMRLAEPADLIDLGRVPGLADLRADGDAVTIGAMVREADFGASDIARRIPLIREACAVIADPLVRNVGTVGGNVAHGDPANDLPAVMLALDAVVLARRVGAEREIPFGDFVRDVFETALEPDEILTGIRIVPPPSGTGSAYVKFERQVGDYAMAAAAAVLRFRDGRVECAALAMTNLAPTAVRIGAAEAALVGREATDAAIAEAAALVADGISPWDDLRATADVKRTMARAAAERALRQARDRAQRSDA